MKKKSLSSVMGGLQRRRDRYSYCSNCESEVDVAIANF